MNSLSPVKGDLLYTELNGNKISDNDCLGRAVIALDRYSYDQPAIEYDDVRGIRWKERNILLNASKYDSNDSNFCSKFSDGTWYITTKQVMQGCNGAMLYWWFNFCDDSEKFHWWHPRKNV